MSEHQLPYGKTQQTLSLPESVQVDSIFPNFVPPAPDPIQVVSNSLLSPLSFEIQDDLKKRDVAIAINDKTRPVPHHLILPPLLDWLNTNGIKASAVKFWIATGSHQPMPPSEFAKVIPESIVNRYRIESHNIDNLENLIHLGTTTRGTPILVNKEYYQAGFKITIGDIEPHHFAGFSGGYKTAAIGLAGRETINHNHSMLVDPNSWIGIYEQNPLRQDIEEIGQKINVNLALNTILNSKKEIVSCFAGHPLSVLQAGIPASRQVCGTPCSKRYDIVIASAGGSPKDINFYQAQKALTHASLFTQPGGTIILVAECPEGSGSATYEEFMRDIHSVNEVFERFSQMEFRVGPHKAFQVARLLNQFSIILVSGMPTKNVSNLLLTPAANVNDAFQLAIRSNRSTSCNVAVLPHATTTLPYLLTGG